MAYISSQSSASRTRTGIAVAVLQAAGIYAIIASLSYVVGPRPADERTTTIFVPKATEKPTETPKSTDNPLPLPSPSSGPLASPSASPTTLPTASASPGEGPGTGTATASPSPLPTAEPSRAAVQARGPAPRGRPGEWVTKNDYPAQDLREGNEGIVRFRLGIGADGRVTSCTITASSGFPRLDAAACAKLSQRARFTPASDENGAKAAGVYYNAVRWSIED